MILVLPTLYRVGRKHTLVKVTSVRVFFYWQGKAINPVRENANRKTIEKIGKKNIVKRT